MTTFQRRERDGALLEVAEAQQRVLALARPFEGESVPIDDALGRVLAEDVVATRDLPPFDNSAMDGFAVSTAEVLPGARVRVSGEVTAGDAPHRTLEAGTVLRIMTGAPVPSGADAVIQVEWTRPDGDYVFFERTAPRGANIRRRGEDMRSGDVILRRGQRIGPGEIGALAAAFWSSIVVSRRPRVAIIATGDELAPIDAPASDDRIANSNSHALAALIRQAGALPVDLGIVRDDRAATTAALKRALDCDVVITSGGVSVGAHDHVKDALDELGAATHFWRVRMKPGKPLVVATIGERLVFGLPGNPVSSLVTFSLFVAPALRRAMGMSNVLPPTISAIAAAPLVSKGDRPTYLRVNVTARDGGLVVAPMKSQGSGVTTSMIGANGLALMQEGVTRVEKGARVEVVMLEAIHFV